MNNEILRTSEEWNSLLCKRLGIIYFIMDPDGWDRMNYEYSFKQEKITKQEFKNRLSRSTTMGWPQEMDETLKDL